MGKLLSSPGNQAVTAPEAAAQAEAPRAEPGLHSEPGNGWLSVRSVVKSFKKRMVVRGVSLDLARGEAVGLLGPNGAGKTTVFYMITGLIPADEGSIKIDGRDVTNEVDIDAAFAEIPTRFRRAGGRDGQILTASSAAANTLAMADDSGAILHAPAPNGLPGGYAVRITAKGGEVILPEGLTMEEAIRINEEGQRYDGIDKIDDDGTVTYAEKSVAIMKDMIGWDCPVLFSKFSAKSLTKNCSNPFWSLVNEDSVCKRL